MNKPDICKHGQLKRQCEMCELEKKVGELQCLCFYMVGVLKSFKKEHYECDEDSWYSCPKSEHGCANESKHDCNCGADDMNREIENVLKMVREFPGLEPRGIK